MLPYISGIAWPMVGPELGGWVGVSIEMSYPASEVGCRSHADGAAERPSLSYVSCVLLC